MGIKGKSKATSPNPTVNSTASTGILSHYKMNEGSGLTLADSGSGGFGDLSNSRSGGASSGHWSPDGVPNFTDTSTPDKYASGNKTLTGAYPRFDVDNAWCFMFRFKRDAQVIGGGNDVLFDYAADVSGANPTIDCKTISTLGGEIFFLISDGTTGMTAIYEVDVMDGVERHFALVGYQVGTNLQVRLFVNGAPATITKTDKTVTKPSADASKALGIGINAQEADASSIATDNFTTYNQIYDFQIVAKLGAINPKYQNGIRYVASNPSTAMPAEYWD